MMLLPLLLLIQPTLIAFCGQLLSEIHVHISIISTTAVCDRHYYLCFIDDEIEAQDQVVRSEADIQIQAVQ